MYWALKYVYGNPLKLYTLTQNIYGFASKLSNFNSRAIGIECYYYTWTDFHIHWISPVVSMLSAIPQYIQDSLSTQLYSPSLWLSFEIYLYRSAHQMKFLLQIATCHLGRIWFAHPGGPILRGAARSRLICAGGCVRMVPLPIGPA